MKNKPISEDSLVRGSRVVFIHPFDAIAGSQRVGVDIVRALRSLSVLVKVNLGFGTNGFISKLDDVSRFSRVNKVKARKLIYPFWLVWMNLVSFAYLVRQDMIWINSVHAAPAGLMALMLSPARVIVHVHEIEFPKIYLRFLRFAEKRGATLLCVSDYHKKALGLKARVLYNCVEGSDCSSDVSVRNELVFVGSTSPAKGFPLFLDVVSALSVPDMRPVAYLSDIKRCDPISLARARELGVTLRFGETDTKVMYRAAYLSLVLSDPSMSSETFSLVSVESISHLVPVGCAGMGVAGEILGDSLAFDVPDRTPQTVARLVSEIWGDRGRYTKLVEACRVRRDKYTFTRFRCDVRDIVAL